MVDNPQKILVIAPPGRVRDALLLLLRSRPDIQLLQPVTDCLLGMEIADCFEPDTIILDCSNSSWTAKNDKKKDGIENFLKHCKQRWPNVPCIALVETPSQIQLALDAGAYTALLKGHTIAQLVERLEQDILQHQPAPR